MLKKLNRSANAEGMEMVYTNDIPRDNKECAEVLNMRVFGGNQEDKTDNGDETEAHHERTANA